MYHHANHSTSSIPLIASIVRIGLSGEWVGRVTAWSTPKVVLTYEPSSELLFIIKKKTKPNMFYQNWKPWKKSPTSPTLSTGYCLTESGRNIWRHRIYYWCKILTWKIIVITIIFVKNVIVILWDKCEFVGFDVGQWPHRYQWLKLIVFVTFECYCQVKYELGSEEY